MTYNSIEQAANKLDISVSRISKLINAGLVGPVEKGGLMFLSDTECYKLRFIIYLQRQHHLELSEIEKILQTHRPPYRDWQQTVAVADQA